MSEEMKSCVTCIHLHEECDGECGNCKNSIVQNENISSVLQSGKFNPEGILIQCKCLECDESNGFKYYEEDEEKTRLLKGST